MNYRNNEKRSVLQRPGSPYSSAQALLDGVTVIAIANGLIDHHIGSLTLEYAIMLLLLMGILAVVYGQFGLYRSHASFNRMTLTLLQAWTVSFFLLTAIGFLSKQSDTFSRLLIVQLYILGFLAQALLHLGLRLIRRRQLENTTRQHPVIIIGHGRLAGYLNQKIASNPWLGERVVGSVLLSQEDRAAAASQSSPGQPVVLGLLDDLPGLLETLRITTVYIVTPMNASAKLEEIYASLLNSHATVHWVPDIFSLRLVNHNVKEIAGIPVLTLSETPLIGTRFLMKSIEDVVLASLILIPLLPLLLLIAIAVKLDSPGPVFFRQPRTGWNGKPFRIWKFRSMVVHQPEGNTLKQAERNDPRITRVGAFLRATSLDELPQIFNVLAGEMSLVGPRPHAIQHDKEYSQRIADYFSRHHIKPGITGLAQVRGYRGETRDLEQMVQRIESDIEYINNWSIWLDLTILMRTVGAFTGKQAY